MAFQLLGCYRVLLPLLQYCYDAIWEPSVFHRVCPGQWYLEAVTLVLCCCSESHLAYLWRLWMAFYIPWRHYSSSYLGSGTPWTSTKRELFDFSMILDELFRLIDLSTSFHTSTCSFSEYGRCRFLVTYLSWMATSPAHMVSYCVWYLLAQRSFPNDSSWLIFIDLGREAWNWLWVCLWGDSSSWTWLPSFPLRSCQTWTRCQSDCYSYCPSSC